MTFNGPIGGLIDFAIGGGWGSEVPKENHSRVAVIRGTDIPKVASGEFSTVPFRYESDKKILNRILAPGDVVLETAGGSSANGQYTGRTLLITQEILDVLGPTICASFCKKLVLNKDLVSPSYFYLYMQDLYKSGRVASYDSQSTGISNFQYEAFVNNELLELPKLEIQTSVASALANLQGKINNNSQISKILEDIAQAIFKSWFIDFDPVKSKMAGETPAGMDSATAALFPDSFEESELGLVPKGWEVAPSTEFFEVLSGGTPKTTNGDYWNGDIPWFSVVDAPDSEGCFFIKTNKTITKEGLDNSAAKLVRPGVTVISARGTVGKTAIVAIPSTFNQSCYGIEGKFGDFFTYLLLRNQVIRLQNISHGGMFDTITRETFSAIKVAKPKPELVSIFEFLVSPIFLEIRNLQFQSNDLASIRDSLLPRLISGELQIPEEMLAS
jgi:type I restriction enzyme S subunit